MKKMGMSKQQFERIFRPTSRHPSPIPIPSPSKIKSGPLAKAKLAEGAITGQKIKDHSVEFTVVFDESELQRTMYEMTKDETRKVLLKDHDKVSVEARHLDRWRKNTDSSTEDWECPENSPHCVSHHQLRRCKLTNQHGPDSEIPRVQMHVSMNKKVRPEVKVFMEGQDSPVAFGTLIFESSEGALAFADALIEHGVVGYIVHSDDE